GRGERACKARGNGKSREHPQPLHISPTPCRIGKATPIAKTRISSVEAMGRRATEGKTRSATRTMNTKLPIEMQSTPTTKLSRGPKKSTLGRSIASHSPGTTRQIAHAVATVVNRPSVTDREKLNDVLLPRGWCMGYERGGTGFARRETGGGGGE